VPLIRTSTALAALCERLSGEEFITVDTEFIRERTYYPQLCLLQLAGDKEAAAIDALAADLDMGPLYQLLTNAQVLKVLHAARQDIEIFLLRSGAVPSPLFDTQIAAMVCGFGEQASYETLAQSLAGAAIDKSARFSDWAVRPLSERQIAYAISDVTHLRTVYRKLRARLERSGRADWVESEMRALTDPALYTVDPREVWRRLRIRSPRPRMLAVLRELAEWRERAAQQRDIPRARMVRDEALLEIAAHQPRSAGELARTRGLPESIAQGKIGQEILAAVARGMAVPQSECPTVEERPDPGYVNGTVSELLRVLLKMTADAHGVAPRLIASAADLDRIAAQGEQANVPALSGWRREIFGRDAVALCQGRLALAVRERSVSAIPTGESRER
jgi:ribonuclease D